MFHLLSLTEIIYSFQYKKRPDKTIKMILKARISLVNEAFETNFLMGQTALYFQQFL
jgi:hypothetical protein